ncbi:MAG: hypothetical protein AB4057_15705 [Crocosphaera sp.]
MTLQEMINSLDNLSQEDMTTLFKILSLKLSDLQTENNKKIINDNDTFWHMTLRFREQMEKEEIEFKYEDFANLRNRSAGRKFQF